QGSQLLDGLVRLVESPHVCVARREKAVGWYPVWLLLQRQEQHPSRLLKSPGEKMAHADPHKGGRPVLARAEPQGRLEMLDRGIGFPSPQPEPGALLPATSETRIQVQSAIDQLDSRIDVLTEVCKHVSGIGEDLRLATGDPKRPPGKIDA